MAQGKVETVWIWSLEKKSLNERPKNLFVVIQLLGICNFKQRFIHKYSEREEQMKRLKENNQSFQ